MSTEIGHHAYEKQHKTYGSAVMMARFRRNMPAFSIEFAGMSQEFHLHHACRIVESVIRDLLFDQSIPFVTELDGEEALIPGEEAFEEDAITFPGRERKNL